MRPATPAERAQLREDLEALQEQYEGALREAGGNTLVNAERLALLVMPALSLLGVRDDNSKRVFAGLEQERLKIVKLGGDWRTWAEAGKRDNGTSYSFAQWQDEAHTTSKSLRDWTGIGAARTAFVAVREAVTDTQRTVQGVADALADAVPSSEEREEMLFWFKVGAAALVGGAVLVGGAYVLRSVK